MKVPQPISGKRGTIWPIGRRVRGSIQADLEPHRRHVPPRTKVS